MNDAVQKLVTFVQNASPYMWRVAFRQAILDGIFGVLLSVGLSSIGVFLRRWWESDEDSARFFSIVCSLLSWVIAICVFWWYASYLINPGYAAIQELVNLCPH